MKWWQVTLLILILVGGCCWLTREAFPKIKYLSPPTDTLLVHDTLPSPTVNIDTLPAVLRLRNKLGIARVEASRWRELYENSLMDSTQMLVAELDTIVSSDTLSLRYNFPPSNTFTDIHIGLPSVVIQSKVVTVHVPQFIQIEKSQFLGGYPEKILWFLGGYGAGTLLGKHL